MYPELFSIGGYSVHTYGFSLLMGSILAYLFLKKEWNKAGLGTDAVNGLFLLAIFGVVVGGKLFYFLERPSFHIKNMNAFFSSFGSGFVFYGCFLGTLPLMIWFFRKKNLNVWDQFDLAAIWSALIYGFGKLGCLMAGCCYGKLTDPGWHSIKFTHPDAVAEPLNQHLYATQLWDAILVFMILGLLVILKNRKQFHGQLILLYTGIYGLGRFFTDSFRGDGVRAYVLDGKFSYSQVIALIMIVLSIVAYTYKYQSAKSPIIKLVKAG